MPRLSFSVVLPILVVAVILTMGLQKIGVWAQPEPKDHSATAGHRPSPQFQAAAADEDRRPSQPPAANASPPGQIDRAGADMNPVPAGTPDVQDRQTPPSATPTAPSGGPATSPNTGN
jgi:hypothetical protein